MGRSGFQRCHEALYVGLLGGVEDIEIKGCYWRSLQDRAHSAHYDEVDSVLDERAEDGGVIRFWHFVRGFRGYC